MSYDVGAGDLGLCVNAARNHATGDPAAQRRPRLRLASDAFLVDAEPKFEAKTKAVSAPKEKARVR